MSLTCLAVVGSLCVSDAAIDFSPTIPGSESSVRINYSHDNFSGSVGISNDSWKADQTVYSDCPGCGPDAKWYSKVCVNDDCISYVRQCDDAEHPTFCEYFFGKTYQPIDVMAKSEKDFQDAISSIGLVTNDRHKSDFPLSLFSEESKAPPNPYEPLVNYMLPKNRKHDGGQ